MPFEGNTPGQGDDARRRMQEQQYMDRMQRNRMEKSMENQGQKPNKQENVLPREEFLKRTMEADYHPENEPSYWEEGYDLEPRDEEKNFIRKFWDDFKESLFGPKKNKAENLTKAEDAFTGGLFGSGETQQEKEAA